MPRSLIVVTPPTQEPLSLTDAKAHLRVDFGDDDAYISSLITASRTRIEQASYTRMLTQTLQLGLDYFPGGWWGPQLYNASFWPPTASLPTIDLEPPVQSVTSVTYVDPAGNTQTWPSADYVVDVNTRPGRLLPAISQAWPTTGRQPGAVKVTFVSGYTTPDAVPADLIHAMKLLLSEWYENRADAEIASRITSVQLPEGVASLLIPYQPAYVA